MKISSEVANEIARLMRDPNALRHKRARMPPSGRHGHYDPNQPRVPAGQSGGGQWTDADGDTTVSGLNDSEHPQLVDFSPGRPPALAPVPPPVQTPVRPPVLPPPRPPAGPGLIGGLLSLFAVLSARNTPDHRAIIDFNAREFLQNPDGEPGRPKVKVLDREEVENACRKLDDVQQRTDRAADHVIMNNRRIGQPMSRPQIGTAIHTHLKRQIDSLMDPNYRAEVSYWKDDEDRYGRKDSIRIDVLENAGRRLVCVYDIKTGLSRGSGLSPMRMLEIADHVLKAYPHVQRVIITEVRPTRYRP